MENIFSSIKVHVPKTMLVLKKNGKVSRVDAVSKSGAIKKVDGEPSIELIAEGNAQPSIEDYGKYSSFDEFLKEPYRIKPFPEQTEESITFDYLNKLLKEKPQKKPKGDVVGKAKEKPERLIRAEPDYEQVPYGKKVVSEPISFPKKEEIIKVPLVQQKKEDNIVLQMRPIKTIPEITDITFSPKRPRGRPPKPKPPIPKEGELINEIILPKKPRGRPPKTVTTGNGSKKPNIHFSFDSDYEVL